MRKLTKLTAVFMALCLSVSAVALSGCNGSDGGNTSDGGSKLSSDSKVDTSSVKEIYPIPNPQSPIPNPQSPIPITNLKNIL